MVLKWLRRKKSKPIPAQEGPPVKLAARGAPSPNENRANLLAARQSEGFVTVKEWIADAIDHRAERVVLDYTAAAVGVRYLIDGVWHQRQPRARNTGDAALKVMKQLANLKPNERRARQEGEFAARYLQLEFTVHLTSQGVETGERVVLELGGLETPLESLDDLGMREKLQERMKEQLRAPKGLMVFSALPDGGLTTTLQFALRATDRYMRDFVALVDRSKCTFPDVENVEVVEYDSSAGESFQQPLHSVLLKEPDVLVIPELTDAALFQTALTRTFQEERLLIVSLRAKDAVDSLVRLLALKPNPSYFASFLLGAMSQRLIRKLCLSCRRPYKPQPQLLQKLGLPPDRVQRLYRTFNPQTDRDEEGKELPPCQVCGAIGFRERTGVFELLVPGEGFRHALEHQPRLEALRSVAQQEGHRGMLEEGLWHVVRGDTTLSELQRVLKT